MIILLVVTNLATYAISTGLIPWLGYRWGAGLFQAGSAQDFGRVQEAYRLLMSEYVDGLDGHELIEGAIEGMADAVGDPWTYYMDPEEFAEFDITLSGEYVGVGMVVEQVGDYATVFRPFPDSPAIRAGLQSGDRIVAVDGKDVVGVPLDIVAGLIRGEEGTEVTLSISRGNPEDPVKFDVTLVRARIIIQSALGKMLYPEEGIGYIQITDFSQKTPAQFREVLADLRDRGLEALVLDLRSNSGGYLSEAIEISRVFVTEGAILHRVGRDGERHTVTGRGGEDLGLPLVVLVNDYTASAAEILAGAIKDNGVGVLAGTTTFGKGLIQTPYELGGGSVLRVTTERWLTPRGHQINENGIEPDVVVTLPQPPAGQEATFWQGFTGDDPEDPRDTQLREAVEILRAELEGETAAPAGVTGT